MTTITFNRQVLFAAVILFAALISGCSSSTSTNTPPANANVTPKTGSTYTYAMFKDTAGTKVPGSDTTINASVTADSQTMLNQSNVYTVIDGGDTTYLTYASNKDVMIYRQTTGLSGLFQSLGDGVFHRWINLAITSKTSGVKILNDTDVIVTVQGFAIPAKVTVETDFIADENVTVGTETMATNHCRITATAVSNTAIISPTVTYTNQRDIYFAPKIGYAAKVTTKESIPAITLLGSTAKVTGTSKTLTAYSIK